MWIWLNRLKKCSNYNNLKRYYESYVLENSKFSLQQYLHTLFFVHKWNSLCLEIVPNAKASPYMIYGSMLENKASHRGIEV